MLSTSGLPIYCGILQQFNNQVDKMDTTTSIIKELKDTLPRHNIGIQVNPYMRSAYIARGTYPWIYALRYGFRVFPQLLIGVDSRFSNANLSFIKYFGYNVGLYNRYSLKGKIIAPFFEVKVYYYQFKEKTWDGFNLETHKKNGFDYYVSPGVSFFFLDNHLQFDAMLQTNYSDIKNGGLSLGIFEFSYRLCYNWGKK